MAVAFGVASLFAMSEKRFGRARDPKTQLTELIKHSDNAVCADCPAKGPRWASASLGVFVRHRR